VDESRKQEWHLQQRTENCFGKGVLKVGCMTVQHRGLIGEKDINKKNGKQARKYNFQPTCSKKVIGNPSEFNSSSNCLGEEAGGPACLLGRKSEEDLVRNILLLST